MSLFLISLTLSFAAFLSHKHKRSFIDKGYERGILQNQKRKAEWQREEDGGLEGV
jgi:hypothetical protein